VFRFSHFRPYDLLLYLNFLATALTLGAMRRTRDIDILFVSMLLSCPLAISFVTDTYFGLVVIVLLVHVDKQFLTALSTGVLD